MSILPIHTKHELNVALKFLIWQFFSFFHLPLHFLFAIKTLHYFVVQIFVEAKRTSPSILYIPHIGQWWETVGPALRATFLSLLSSIPAFSPILLLATCNLRYNQLSVEVLKLFIESSVFWWLFSTWIFYRKIFSCLRFRSCSEQSMGRFFMSQCLQVKKEETSLRTWYLTRLLKPLPLKRKQVRKKMLQEIK